MALYKVKASYMVYCEVYIEADSDDEAQERAEQLDGGDFDMQRTGSDDWAIDSVSKV